MWLLILTSTQQHFALCRTLFGSLNSSHIIWCPHMLTGNQGWKSALQNAEQFLLSSSSGLSSTSCHPVRSQENRSGAKIGCTPTTPLPTKKLLSEETPKAIRLDCYSTLGLRDEGALCSDKKWLRFYLQVDIRRPKVHLA